MCTCCLGLFICDGGGLLSHSYNCSCCIAIGEWKEHGFVVQAGRRMAYKGTNLVEAYSYIGIKRWVAFLVHHE
jgi:hypothetical protein